MARRNMICIYDRNHSLQIFNKNHLTDNRCININITDFDEYVQIKVRDISDFAFNYTTYIDLKQFDLMQTEQCLDINFNEFKTNIVDMLQQVQKHEMFLKCDTDGNSAKLIFYGKSKIKSIIFLTVDLQATSQKEIFNEMNSSIFDLQNINKNLTCQIQTTQRMLQEKDLEIDKRISVNKLLEKKFIEELQNLDVFFSKQLEECSTKLLNKILLLTQKFLKLVRDVEVVKAESLLKSDSCARLLESMENLRLESVEMSKIVNELKRENCMLKSTELNNEKVIRDLNETLESHQKRYVELEKLKNELERDVKQATVIIAQKTSINEELAKDVVQANQMLVNFNHLFNTKNEEIEKLKNQITTHDKIIEEHTHRYHELCKEFEEYTAKFNSEEQNKLLEDLSMARKRIEEMEKQNREMAKLNELLTRKLASGDFTRRNFL